MKILLWDDVDKLGKRGDVIEVSAGYARNYLFPKKIATLATEDKLAELEKQKEKLKKKELKILSDLKLLAEKIQASKVTIEMNANEEGKLYGSITPSDVADALRKEGILVQNEWIELDESIKMVGFYNIKIKPHKDIECIVKIWVVSAKTSKDSTE
jgi:large subunit ribosomal protein L9